MKLEKNKLAYFVGRQARMSRLASTAAIFCGVLAGAGSNQTFAEEDEAFFSLEEIIVTARRKGESLQDTPVSINAVTDEKLKDLNITNFADLSSVVAGLTLDEDVLDAGASLRGVKYEVLAQSPASVEFYVNDSNVTALQALQKMFDVSQVEVLRGPQGTLRGRAAPSGAITVTTAAAQSDFFGGYVDASLSDDGDQNYQAAVNIPIIEDRLAIRVAGFWDESNLNNVSSSRGRGSSEYEGDGYRFTLTATPIDKLYINATYERMQPERTVFSAVESVAGAPLTLDASDRKSVQDLPEFSTSDIETTTLNVVWEINDKTELYYTGGYHSVRFEKYTPRDVTNALGPVYDNNPAYDVWQGEGSLGYNYTDSDTFNHEIRLQSTEPLFDKLDYVLGAFYEVQKDSGRNDTVTFIDIAGTGTYYVDTAGTSSFIQGSGKNTDSQETSFFTNLTYHFSDNTNLSVGVRHIEFNKNNYNEIPDLGIVLSDVTKDENKDIYTAILTHHFNEDIMGYASWGTSWRDGPDLAGVLSTNPYTATMSSFANLPSETSESFELGMKSSWLDGRLQTNVALYRQEFDNFPFRSPEAVFYDGGFFGVLGYNLDAPVPVIVNGAELEVNFAATQNLTVSALLSYSKGEVDNGVIPCNVYGGVQPSSAEIAAATGGDMVASCTTDQRTNTAPDLNATLTAEYSFQVGEMDAHIRGLYSWRDSTENSPSNEFDDVSSYGLLNLYAGLSDPEGTWSAMLYVKNVADTERVINRTGDLSVIPVTVGAPPAAPLNITSTYRDIDLTPSREIGLNLRYNF